MAPLDLVRRLLLVWFPSCLLLAAGAALAQTPAAPPDDPLRVTTRVFDIAFSAAGGVPVQWQVSDRPRADAGEQGPLDLLDPDAAQRQAPFAVVLGPIPAEGALTIDRRTYEVARTDEGGGPVLTFTSPVDATNLQIEKTFAFAPEDHLFRLRVVLRNRGTALLEIGADGVGPGVVLGPGLGFSPARRPELHEERFLAPHIVPFVRQGDAVTSLDLPAEPPYRAALPAGSALGFGGLQAPFTALALVPESGPPLVSATVCLDPTMAEDDRDFYPCLVLSHAPLTIAAGEAVTLAYAVYAGPKTTELLRAPALGLEEIRLNYLPQWLIVLCDVIEAILQMLHRAVGSWGLAIVVFAILFRVLVLPLSLYGAKHQILMKRLMAELKPKVAEIKQRHAKNAEARNQAILALYKEHGVNPFAHFKGCLPLFLQLPVLIALVQILLNSYDLLGSRFLWIADLTRTDQLFPLPFTLPWLGGYFNLLPMLMFVAMILVAMRMRAAEADPQGPAALMLVLPVLMLLLFYPFPSGCMLFWTTGTLLQIGEQSLITARFRRGGAASAG